MAEIQLSGLATGIDTKAIVDQLMAVEERRLQNYKLDLADVNDKDEAMAEFKTGLTEYESALSDIYTSSQLKSFEAKSADEDYITASASSNASEGTYSMQVKQLATSDRWIHDGVEYRSSLVGSGDLILSYGDAEMVITTDSNTTLEGLMGLINNNPANEGIKASILQYDAGDGKEYHLVLAGQDSGSDFQININDQYTQVIASDVDAGTGYPLLFNGENAAITTKLTLLDNVTDGPLAVGDIITVQGTDHYDVSVDVDINVDQYTTIEDLLKEIEDAYNGSAKASYENGQIKLTAHNDGKSSLEITSLTFDGTLGSGASMDLPDFDIETTGTWGGTSPSLITDFLASTFIEMQSAQDSKVKMDGYPLDTAIAEEQTLATTGGDASGGSYRLTYQGHTTADIAYNADAAAIELALEALDNVAVGDITVVSTGSLDDGSDITFTFLPSAGNVDLIAFESSPVDPLTTTATHAITQTVQGADGWLPTSGNVFTGIDGISVNLHDDTYDGVGDAALASSYNEIQVSISRDTEALEKKIETLQEKYNAIIDFKIAKASYDPETKEKGVLYGDYSIAAIFSQLKSPFTTVAEGFTNNDEFYQPSDIGITIDGEGKMEFDKAEFSEAIAEDYNAVLDLMGAFNTGSTSGPGSTKIGFYEVGSSTVPGAYSVRVFGDDAGNITSAWMKKIDETWSEAREATINYDGTTYTIVGESTYIAGEYAGFYENPENNLTLIVQDASDIAGSGDKEDTDGLDLTVFVKQGFAGESKSLADELLKATTGRIAVARKVYQSTMDRINVRIVSEQARLERQEKYLIQKFARLESTLSMINQQMAVLNA